MEFSPMATDVAEQMSKAVDFILGLDISPADKVNRLVAAFKTVGEPYYAKVFADNSLLFGSEMISSVGFPNVDDQIQRLAEKLVQNYNLGREVNKLVVSFYDSALGQAQKEAFDNAISLQKHPTLTRRVVSETCRWCYAMAGTFTNPTSDMFRRHENCDCVFKVSGYNSRNGVLTNYKKKRRK
jgi:hypothetical protein